MSFRAPNPVLLEIKSLFPASAPAGILRIWLTPENNGSIRRTGGACSFPAKECQTIFLSWLPLVLLFFFSCGLGLLLSALAVYFRDMMHLYLSLIHI